MPGVRFELMTPAFERAKTVHALDRAATVFGGCHYSDRFIIIIIDLYFVCVCLSFDHVSFVIDTGAVELARK
jgi:hypothetical protein